MEEDKRLIFRDTSLEKKFERDGFVILPFLSSNELQALTQSYQLLEAPPANQGFHSTMMSDNEALRKKVDEEIKSKLSACVSGLLKGYKILFANFIVKESVAQSEVGVHQDWTYANEDLFSTVNFWIPLTTVSDTNGPLYIVSGSHRLPTSIRFTPYQTPPWKNLFEKIKSMGIKCEVKPGEAVLYHPAVLHFSPPNLSGTPRVAVGMVSIPKEATPLHYYKNENSQIEELEKYEVNPEFFYSFEIDKKPGKNAILREKVPFEHLTFSENQLESLQKETQILKGILGRIKKVFNK